MTTPALKQTNKRTAGLGALTADLISMFSVVSESLHSRLSLLNFLYQSHTNHTRGLTGFIYKHIRKTSRYLGDAGDTLTIELQTKIIEHNYPASTSTDRRLETLRAVLNGILGDHLERTQNVLAIPMMFRLSGEAITPLALARTVEKTGGKLVILVHGLCMSHLNWTASCGYNHGAVIAEATNATLVNLHYNTGLPISVNGRNFSQLLAALAASCNHQLSMTIIAHSMGGLVSRSACHYASNAQPNWLPQLKSLIFLGTPHHGSLLERAGNIVDEALEISKYSAPFSNLGKIRSQGITDLRYGNIIDEDWQNQDRFRDSKDRRIAVALPESVTCFAIAATHANASNYLTDHVIGDGLVTLESALGIHANKDLHLGIPEAQTAIVRDMSHNGLLRSPAIAENILTWLEDGNTTKPASSTVTTAQQPKSLKA